MSPSGNVGMELPPPVSEQLPPVNMPENTGQSHEQQVVSPIETAPTASSSQPLAMPSPPMLDLPNASLSQQTTASGSASTQSSGLVADDGDLIEKEWVHKARAIVERTKEDPYKQSEELTLLKADYLQKRYGKTLKQST